MILVDSSVWIDHLAKGVSAMTEVLDAGEVVMHPFVLGEIACGLLEDRPGVLDLMSNLLEPIVATHDEVLTLIERRRLMGRGIGYIDMHLLASALLTDTARLWTRDRRLCQAARELDIAYKPTTG